MKNFLLVTNSVKDKNSEYSGEIISLLEKGGACCMGNIFTSRVDADNYYFASPSDVPEGVDVIIVLGGDGTFIHVAKDLITCNIPIIGVNLGNLGYLTEIDVHDFKEDCRKLLAGDYHIEDRMLLFGEIIRNGKSIAEDIALNDIVLFRGQSGIIDYEVNVNGRFLNRYSADGIIVSTPTGSTGYNLSAGGPVVYPTAQIMLATPICAHTLNSRSIAFSADAVIEIIIKERSGEKKQQKVVSFDGSSELLLENEDVIRVSRSSLIARIMRLNDMSFVEHLGKKMR